MAGVMVAAVAPRKMFEGVQYMETREVTPRFPFFAGSPEGVLKMLRIRGITALAAWVQLTA